MPRRELDELLDRLNSEMASVDDLNDESRAKLEDLKTRIAALLADHENQPAESELTEPVQAAIDDFEKTHPALTMTLGRIMDILNKMGI